MPLISFSYSEFDAEPRKWSISDATFSNINLIVGRNASGKSRLLATINSLARLLSGKQPQLFPSCSYDIVVMLDGQKFCYTLKIVNSNVTFERLTVDGIQKLERAEEGKGEIYYESEKRNLPFQLPTDSLAALNRRDPMQHSFLSQLNTWASNVAYYPFGTDFGRSRVMTIDEYESRFRNKELPSGESENLIAVYTSAYEAFGEEFDKSIIADMASLGYSLSDVGSTNLQPFVNASSPLLGLFTTEHDLGFQIPQFSMSQGMFRALALVIHLNWQVFSKRNQLILVDDVGEGLDYERATAIISLLIDKAESHGMQLIMTSNDRFVMNKVPLEYWSVIKRKGSVIQIYNSRNSHEKFKEFKFLGMNNFDFFASDFLDSENLNA